MDKIKDEIKALVKKECAGYDKDGKKKNKKKKGHKSQTMGLHR